MSTRVGDEIRIEARARSFLHHQVRNMVGTLKLVGLGQWRPDDVAAALAARDRRAGGPTAPAEGLYLVEVRYPDRYRDWERHILPHPGAEVRVANRFHV